VALLFSAVAIKLSENTVPETTFSPLMVTWPETDNSPDGAFAAGDANTTIE
jgi:hypothetical protein